MNKTITLTDEQYQALTSGQTITIEPPKPKPAPKFKLNAGEWYVDSKGTPVHTADTLVHPASLDQFNNRFTTVLQASLASNEIEIFNALLQRWLDLVGTWRPDWSDNRQNRYQLYMCNMEWITNVTSFRQDSPFIFPTRALAETFILDMKDYLNQVGV